MCGAAAVATVLNHLAMHPNQVQVAEGTETTKQLGTPWKGLVKYVSAKRLRCTITKETPATAIQGLVRERKYVLLDWGDWPGHWVLVAGWEGAQEVIVLMDPCRRANPFVGMKWPDFQKFWGNMPSAVPRIAIEIRQPKRNTRSAKGFEGRTNFSLQTWDYVHGSKNRSLAAKDP